jgi:threonine/homoserine/homoserine lactone efflux protein
MPWPGRAKASREEHDRLVTARGGPSSVLLAALAAMLLLVQQVAGRAIRDAFFLTQFSVSALPNVVLVSAVIALVGGVVLLWMGFGLGRGAVNGSIVSDLEVAEEPTSKAGPIAHGALVSLSNPYWTLWWATIGVTLATKGLAIGPLGVLAFFVGHELGDTAWYLIVIFAVSSGRRLLSGKVYRVVIGVCAAFLLLLGVRFAVEAIRFWA